MWGRAVRRLLLCLFALSTAAHAEIFLVGTITGNPSIATVRSGDKVLSLRVGEPVDGWIIKKIAAKEIIITSPSAERVLRTGEYLANEKLIKGLEIKGDEIHMSREVHKYIAEEELTIVVMGATADAVFDKEGQVTGFRIWNFDPGSVYDLAGLEDGDVITALDGKPLTSPAQAITLLKQIKHQDKFTVTMLRGGEPKTLKVLVN